MFQGRLALAAKGRVPADGALRMIGDVPDAGGRAGDDELAQKPATHLADLGQSLRSTAGTVAWRETGPGRKTADAMQRTNVLAVLQT